MKKAVIFDFDYTLGDSTGGIVESALYALEKLKEEKKSKEQIVKTIGLSLEETYIALTGKEDKEKQSLFKKYFIEKADDVMVSSTKLYTDTVFVLENLKKCGFKTGIVTTKLNTRIQSILKKFNIDQLIDVIIGVENVKNTKPHPEGLLLSLKELGLEKNEVFYIGDSYIDALAAENAGIDFIAVLSGTTTEEIFKKYKSIYICECLKEAYKKVINNREEIQI